MLAEIKLILNMIIPFIEIAFVVLIVFFILNHDYRIKKIENEKRE
jgi:hypothetical protein